VRFGWVFRQVEDLTRAVVEHVGFCSFFDGLEISGHSSTRASYRLWGYTQTGLFFSSKVVNLFAIWGGEGKVWEAKLDAGQDDKQHQKEVYTFFKDNNVPVDEQSEPYTVLQLWQLATTFHKTATLCIPVEGMHCL